MTVLLYHIVCSAKCPRGDDEPGGGEVLKEACLEIAKLWEIWFLEIGVDRDHAHFLVQSVPTYSVSKIVQTLKSATAREVFAKAPEMKRKLWRGSFGEKDISSTR